MVEEHFHRAAPGGMGGTKAAGNYSPVSHLFLSRSSFAPSPVGYLLNCDGSGSKHLESESAKVVQRKLGGA